MAKAVQFSQQRRAYAIAAGLSLIVSTITGAVGQSVHIYKANNVTLPLYSDDFSRLLGVIKADRIYLDERKLGFFRVKLLPILVVQDVRISMSDSLYATNLLSAFKSNVAPMAKRGPVEWRDVSVSVDGERAPRLRAARVTPPTAGSDFCAVEGATIQCGTETVVLHHAKLLLQANRAQLSWEERGSKRYWDFITAQPLPTKTTKL